MRATISQVTTAKTMETPASRPWTTLNAVDRSSPMMFQMRVPHTQTVQMAKARRRRASRRFTPGSYVRALAALVAVGVSACGDDAPAPAAPTSPVVAEVKVTGSYEHGAFHYLRIEDKLGNQVVESRFASTDDKIRLERRLAYGQYRLLSFQRPCSSPCLDADDNEQVQPEDICGTQFDVRAGKQTSLVVDLQPGEGCSAHVT